MDGGRWLRIDRRKRILTSRSLFTLAIVSSALLGLSACLPDNAERPAPGDGLGVLLLPGKATRVEMLGECRIITSHLKDMRAYIQTSHVTSWPDFALNDQNGNPIVTWELCS